MKPVSHLFQAEFVPWWIWHLPRTWFERYWPPETVLISPVIRNEDFYLGELPAALRRLMAVSPVGVVASLAGSRRQLYYLAVSLSALPLTAVEIRFTDHETATAARTIVPLVRSLAEELPFPIICNLSAFHPGDWTAIARELGGIFSFAVEDQLRTYQPRGDWPGIRALARETGAAVIFPDLRQDDLNIVLAGAGPHVACAWGWGLRCRPYGTRRRILERQAWEAARRASGELVIPVT